MLVSVRIEADTLRRIDAVVGSRGRSRFIREAISAVLAGAPIARSEKVISAPAPVERPSGIDRRRVAQERWVADEAVLMGALRERPMTVRMAAEGLGWHELRVGRVADRLVTSGLVHFPARGVMALRDA